MARTTLRLSAIGRSAADTKIAIEQAAEILRRGGTVAFATETVYGLGANALNATAVEQIFEAKQRPHWDPLIVHVADLAGLESLVVSIPEPARRWAERFWPGPLTLLLPRSHRVPDAVTAGRALVGIRVPAHPVAQALLRACALPVAAPSANRFGHVSPTTAAHVLADLDGRIDAVLDGGPAEHGLESTVVDASSSPCRVYRPGAISLEELREIWPDVELFAPTVTQSAGAPEALPSPGVGMRHYAPRAQLRLVAYDAGQADYLLELAQALRGDGIGILLPDALLTETQRQKLPAEAQIFAWGCWNRPEEMARLLFAGLRTLDDLGVSRILCPVPKEHGLGVALADRLRKAARSA